MLLIIAASVRVCVNTSIRCESAPAPPEATNGAETAASASFMSAMS